MDSRRKLKHTSQARPVQTLVQAFIGWKALLGLVVLLSQGIGYDTSTDLLLSQQDELQSRLVSIEGASTQTPRLSWALSKLVRWDAIYCVTLANRGYVYEQEWFFGWGFAKLTNLLAASLPLPGLLAESFSAVVISNLAHLVSVLLLFKLCWTLNGPESDVRTCIVVAGLHIIAPAGVFLSAPYGESLFAALSFAGYLFYALSVANAVPRVSQQPLLADAQLLLAGLCFGISCTVRSNGIFSGLLFAVELAQALPRFLNQRQRSLFLRRMAGLVIAGIAVAMGFCFPQYLAWTEYCGTPSRAVGRREWCDALPPSVYTFVQAHYWNVGFLHYWTLSNLPLFILALPMLGLMIISALDHVRWTTAYSVSDASVRETIKTRLAIPQLLLAGLAVTVFHVQTITRIASAYPLVYFALESHIRRDSEVRLLGWRLDLSKAIVMWMVMYALIQAGLFASFLPPA